MSKKKCFSYFLGILLVMGGMSSAHAEAFQKEVILSPMLGVHHFHHDQDLDTGFSLGAGLGYRFDPRWMAEIMVHGSKTEHKKTAVDTRALHVSANALHIFRPDKTFRPYGAAGMGVLSRDPEGGKADRDFALNAGGGFFVDIVKDLAFRMDFRGILPPDGMEWNLAAHTGLAWTFGRTPAVAPILTPPKPLDSDGDGVPDYRDRCPDTPPGVPVDQWGCPIDSDGDGVPDYRDRCPDTPPGVPVDQWGCPLDSDGDGVPDYLDHCPGTPVGARVNALGCWEIQGLTFGTASNVIESQYHGILDEVVAVLRRNPDLKIEVAGYTDSRGSDAYNRRLSRERATAVRDYFVRKGIDGARLRVVGYGPDNPIADNDTAEGRARNRRVELTPAP
ncbi:OOP family OmpA-OmpF porin [Desulfobotulus alkaliphilus]|uniref:OOP family OmpA-OmpF porin n=1 Tax=Desulfobotulus alkaliphilus TaxID=622671 RepID=A0A562S8T3_9BACT|nr:OmpA family protein [Desulfobotulus alkaliphilus]TWI76870.1 OOP family OmpA-OmpF porin [Desulfobotulus alkaliphilus]